MVDFQDILKNPFFGMGRHDITRFGGSDDVTLVHRNNGVTDFAVKMGLIFFIFYFYFKQKKNILK